MRKLLPVLVLFISGCGSTNRFFWNRQATNVCHSPSCSNCSPHTSYSVGSDPSPGTVYEGEVIHEGMMHDNMMHNGMIHGTVIDSGGIPSANEVIVPTTPKQSAGKPESVPMPEPDPQT